MLGTFVKIKERINKMVTRTVTTKAEEQNIKDDNYISPSGHMMFLKNKVVDGPNISAQLVGLGGARMSDGRTWSMASTLMSRTIDISGDDLELGDLTVMKSFQITSSHKNKTCMGSVTPNLINAGATDLEPEESFLLRVVIYGGQFTDKIVTSDEVILITGTVECDMDKSRLKVIKHPARNYQYQEFQIPEGWSSGSHLVQTGEVPTSRTGAGFSKLRSVDGSDLLLSTGGHSKEKITQPFFHPEDSINVLKVPEMTWKKLEPHDYLKRSFHSQTVNTNGEVIIVGGMSMIDGRWSRIYPLNEILKISVNEDFSYSGTKITLTRDIRDLSILTNFSYTAHENKLYFFSGFSYEDYKDDNLYEFLPPKTSRDKLPKFGRSLIKIDLEEGTIASVEGPEDCGGYNGSIVMLNSSEMIISQDPHMYLYSERVLKPPKCDLPDEFGSCSLPMTSKNNTTYTCRTPACLKVIHLKCDKSIRGTKCSTSKLCPTCSDLDSVTWKKKKSIRLNNRK